MLGKGHYDTYCCMKCMKISALYKQRCADGVSKVWENRTKQERKAIGQKILEKNNKNPKILENRRKINEIIYSGKTEEEIKKIKEKRLNSLHETWKNRTKEENMEMQKKSRKTRLKNHGNETWNNRDKAKETCKNNCGYDYWMQTPEARKIYSKRFKNYSDEEWETFKEHVSKGLTNLPEKKKQEMIDKRLKTMSNKTTKELEEIKLKKQQTWKKKSKDELREIHRKQTLKTKHKYIYKNVSFHSYDEMAYYIYNVECTNNTIIRNNLEYDFVYNYNGKDYLYYPDFIVNGKYVEIKGLQFFENKDPNGKLINPYDRSEDGKYEAKQQCMKNNNVEVITETSKYIEYTISKYGRKIRID